MRGSSKKCILELTYVGGGGARLHEAARLRGWLALFLLVRSSSLLLLFGFHKNQPLLCVVYCTAVCFTPICPLCERMSLYVFYIIEAAGSCMCMPILLTKNGTGLQCKKGKPEKGWLLAGEISAEQASSFKS